MKIYLAGGLRSTPLREQLLAEFREANEVVDPADCPVSDEGGYTAWELEQIRSADCVVAFMENDNPSGYGLSFEVGFAHALGKPVYFYDRLTDNRSRFFGMVRSVSEVK